MTNFDNILSAMQQLQGQSQTLTPQDSTIVLDKIQERTQDTRKLNQQHIKSLAESIAVLGLIEPLVVDNQARLLAGGHRLAAICLLKAKQVDKYQQHFPNELIPIRVLPFDAEEETGLALQVEIAENEQRKDYTPSEVKSIANRLREAGYVDLKGRPKKGEKPLMPALAVVVGKHLRTVQRYLESEEKPEENPVEEKSTTRVALLNKVFTLLKGWKEIQPETEAEKALAESLPELMTLIRNVLEEKAKGLTSMETTEQ